MKPSGGEGFEEIGRETRISEDSCAEGKEACRVSWQEVFAPKLAIKVLILPPFKGEGRGADKEGGVVGVFRLLIYGGNLPRPAVSALIPFPRRMGKRQRSNFSRR
jgi:hypothetical protein